ncbi:DNA adenine methylase [Helicobacter sp. T3_23-1056]
MTWNLAHKAQNQRFIKSPLNYIGGKYRLLPQILPLFPKQVDSFVDLFCGGLNVAINVESSQNSPLWHKNQIYARQIICNDNLVYLIELYEFLRSYNVDFSLQNLEQIIATYHLNSINTQGYNALRDDYNKNKTPLKLLALIAHAFNHQIRFNNAHKFNTPFGKNRSTFNATMRQNLICFIHALQSKNFAFYALDFREFLSQIHLTKKSFLYADPPYLITQGTYNDGKRGFSGWSENLEIALLESLANLHKKGIRFALSNVLSHKGNQNKILQDWVSKNNFFTTHLEAHYTNANYQTKHKDKSKTKEVLITNYNPLDLG